MAIPAGAPFSKYIDDNILTPLISRLDFMLIDSSLFVPEPDGSTDTDEIFNGITGRLRDLQELFRKIGEEELALVQGFNTLEKYIDGIFESIAAGRSQGGEIRRRLHTLKKQVVDLRDAILKPHAPREESAGGGGEAPAPTKATGPIRVIRNGNEMAHLRRAVSGMDEPLKSCLLSLAAFPEGAIVKNRLLIHWWIGEELVGDAVSGKRCFDQLVEMKFVRAIHRQHCGTAHWCTVHPWIHGMIVAVANSSAFIEVALDGDEISINDFERTRRACLRNGKTTTTTTLHFHPEVSSIYNIDHKYVKLSADWFAKKACLRTLQLGQWRVFDESKKSADAKRFHVELIHDDQLKGIGACRNLRYLSLRGISRIDSIPDAVGNLSELIVLDLRACYNLQELTNNITKLRKLQYLDVSECYLLLQMPRGLGDISSLQVLKGFVVASSSRRTACRVSELVGLDNLRKLSICIGKKVMKGRPDDELKKLARLGKLESLRITWALMTTQQGDTKNSDDMKFSLPATLVKLDLQCFPSRNLGQLLNTDGLSKLENLQKLCITGGVLDSLRPLGEGRNLKLKVLRLRFLGHLQDDECHKLGANYPELKILRV